MLQIHEKIEQARISAGLTQGELAEKIGINRSTYQYWEKTTPSTEKIIKVAKALNLPDDYFFINDAPAETSILMEKEEFLGMPGVAVVETQADIKNFQKRLLEKKNSVVQKAIPVYDTDVAASKADLTLFDDKNGSVPIEYLYVPEFSGCIAIFVYSNSMAPLLNPGSRMFIRKIEHWQDALEYGQIYIVGLHDGRRFLKYIKKSKDQATHFLLKSHNPEYDDFEITKTIVKSIWIVDGWMNKHTQSTFHLLKK